MKLYPAVEPSNPKELPVGDCNQGYNYVTEPSAA